MEHNEIMHVLAQGEDSKIQFKKDINHIEALAMELIAFSNTLGGKIFIGVDDDGTISGLQSEDIRRINQLLSNAASQNVKPAINPLTEIVTIDEKRILIIDIPQGISKPYQDKNGVIWVKSGADKRKATSREELQQLFQSSGLVKCICYPGIEIDESNYIESQDNTGTIADVFKDTVAFLVRNIRSLQGAQSVNSLGIKEIPKIVFEELVTNALIHRDYFISAPIRIFIFSDRIEIISPGHLPNDLTIENIKAGNSNIRNPILASFATKMLPYRGLGNGIRRALKAYPDIDFIDDHEGNLFTCVIRRKRV